ncbi:MAG: DUF177 domain-containing protein [Rhodobacteraceae bacterium]|nr:DUF177 domain-containing protein [Paracoccaceae bacterium]
MTPKYTDEEQQAAQIRVADLPQGVRHHFDLVFTENMLAGARGNLELPDISKVRIVGDLEPEGRTNWMVMAKVGATITQTCVVTLAPVKTRIDEPVRRHYIANWQEPEGETEVEMDDDDAREPLGEIIDLEQIALEVVALSMPSYPRARDAALETTEFAAPGIVPLTDDDVKPFASLAALRDRLEQ